MIEALIYAIPVTLIIAVIVAVCVAVNNSSEEKVRAAARKAYIENNSIPVSKRYACTSSNPVYEVIVNDEGKELLVSSIKNVFDRIPYEKIIGCDTVVNGQTTGHIGRALVGGVLAGGAGAVVGAVSAKECITQFRFYIYLDDPQNPQISMYLISHETKREGLGAITIDMVTGFAQNLTATVKSIVAYNDKSETQTAQEAPKTTEKHTLDRLSELKQLLENGLITEEEYDEKRRAIIESL